MPHTEDLVSGINITLIMQKSVTACCCHSVISGIPLSGACLWPAHVLRGYLTTSGSLLCGRYFVARGYPKWHRHTLQRGYLSQHSSFYTYSLLPWSHHWYFRSFLATELIVHKHSSESCKDRLLYLGQSLHTKKRIT